MGEIGYTLHHVACNTRATAGRTQTCQHGLPWRKRMVCGALESDDTTSGANWKVEVSCLYSMDSGKSATEHDDISLIDQALLQGIVDEFRIRFHLHLAQDTGAMSADSFDAQGKDVGDVRGAFP